MTRVTPALLRAGLALALATVTVVVYAQVRDFDFLAMDDRNYVADNPRVAAGITGPGLAWAFTTFHASNWHPVTWVSHMVDCDLFGLDPGAHHLVNLALHVANTLLLFVLLDRLTGRALRSGFVAALFALHPLHVESVAWIAERKDLLSALFGLAAFLAYAAWRRSGGGWRYACVVLWMGMSLMSKPMLVSLPVLLLLLDRWPLGRAGGGTPVRSLVLEKVPLAALAAASCVVTVLAQRRGGAVVPLETYSLGVRAGNAVLAYGTYIGKMFLPVDLSAFYPHPGAGLSWWGVAAAGLFLAAVTWWVLRARDDRPYLLVGWLWYVVALLPVIGVVQVGRQALADRYTYLPLIGLFVMIAWGVPDLVSRVASGRGAAWWTRAAGVAVLTAAAMLTWSRVADWRDSRTLFEQGIRVNPRDYFSHANLGWALQREGRLAEAVEHYREAIEINPRLASARNNLGLALAETGRLEEAEDQYRAVLSLDPSNVDARNNLGGALQARGRIDEAIREFEAAVRAAPDDARSHYNLGIVLAIAGRSEEAIDRYRRAIALNPGNPRAHNNLGSALDALGRTEEAIVHFREALRIEPGRAISHNNLGVALLRLGRPGEAAGHLREATAIDPTYAKAHHNLALALHALGDLSGAWREVRIVRRLGVTPDPAFVSRLSAAMPDPSP